MKKIFMTMAAMVIAASASAQVYIGGGVGLSSTKVGDGDSKMSYKIVPEIGYQFDKKLGGWSYCRLRGCRGR